MSRVKVKLADFKKANYHIPEKPSFTSTFAFVQANRALGELLADVLKAKAEKREEVSLSSDRATALALYGVYWAKREGEGVLSRIKNFLIEKTREKEEKEPALKGLPSSLVEKLKEMGADFLEGITDEDLVKMSLAQAKELDFGVKENLELAGLERHFALAVEGGRETVWSRAAEKEVEAFTERLIEEFKKLFEENPDREKFFKRLRNLSQSVAYEIQRPYRLYGELMAGKSLIQALAPEDPDSLFHRAVAKDKLAAFATVLHKAYNPSFKPEDYASYRFADYTKGEDYTPAVLVKVLRSVMTEEMEKAAERLEKFYAQKGFMPYAYEVAEKAREKGVENPFELDGEKFEELMEEIFAPQEKEPIMEEEIDELGVEF